MKQFVDYYYYSTKLSRFYWHGPLVLMHWPFWTLLVLLLVQVALYLQVSCCYWCAHPTLEACQFITSISRLDYFYFRKLLLQLTQYFKHNYIPMWKQDWDWTAEIKRRLTLTISINWEHCILQVISRQKRRNRVKTSEKSSCRILTSNLLVIIIIIHTSWSASFPKWLYPSSW